MPIQSESKWFPYLTLVPNNEEAGSALPLLWSECERERLLSGTGVQERVEGDLRKIDTDFQTVVLPFMKRHPDLFRYIDICNPLPWQSVWYMRLMEVQ